LAGVSAGGRRLVQPAKPGMEDLEDVLRACRGMMTSFGTTFSLDTTFSLTLDGIAFSLWNRGGEGSRAEGAEMMGGDTVGGLALLLLFDQPKISPNPFLVLVFFCNFVFSARDGEALSARKAGMTGDLNDRGAVLLFSSVRSDILDFFSPNNDDGIFLSEFRMPPPVPRKLDGGN
jgi:hypothetical protein